MENIDRFGHCAKCHKDLTTERVVGGKVIKMFTPQYDETEFLLTDGSRMRVCICKACKENNLDSPVVKKYIMDAVKSGWQLEVDNLVADESRKDWDKARADSHMAKYNVLEIDCHSENLEKHVIEAKIKDISERLTKAKEINDATIELKTEEASLVINQ